MSEVDSEVDDEIRGEDAGEGLVLRNPIGEYYGGRNDKNERHGRGRTVLPNGDLYLGCYYRGKRHGLGVYRYKNGNGARYGGDWSNGTRHGWGTMYFPDGSQYTGNWHKGNIHGWGVYVYSNGDEYEGWFFMGSKNGRGIYRTKATNEKFVGSWLLGLKHGPGMLIRKEHRLIGNWYNDVPKGPAVYVFPELGTEQHGRFSIVKLQSEARPGSRYKNLGHQIMTMRSTPPPQNPFDVEANTRLTLEMNQMYLNAGEAEGDAEEAGEEGVKFNVPGAKRDSKSSEGKTSSQKKEDTNKEEKAPVQNMQEIIDQQVVKKLKEFVNLEEEAAENNKTEIALVWTVRQVTKLITKYPDETVPPPPLPATPMPEVEASGEEDEDESSKKASIDADEAIRQAKLLAKTHTLGDIYTGSGVCQLPLAKIRWPDDFVPPRTFSKITVSTIEEFKNVVESVAPQLEPLDIQAIIAENLNVFRGHGINVSDKWKDCLGNETECEENMDIKGPPPPGEERKSSQAGSKKNSQAGSTGSKKNSKDFPEEIRKSQERRYSPFGETEIDGEGAYEYADDDDPAYEY